MELNQKFELLNQARFKQFWSTTESMKLEIELISRIREFIAKTITITFQSIDMKILQEDLNIKDKNEMINFCKDHDWQINENIVITSAEKETSQKPVVIKENIKFEQLSRIIGNSNHVL
jgi:translation initiation factor 3 subunit K